MSHFKEQHDEWTLSCVRRGLFRLPFKGYLTAFPCVCYVCQDKDDILENVAQKFHRIFTRNDHFKVGCALCILLCDNLLTRTQVWLRVEEPHHRGLYQNLWIDPAYIVTYAAVIRHPSVWSHDVTHTKSSACRHDVIEESYSAVAIACLPI